MTNHDDCTPRGTHFGDFDMDLGDQRAGCIEYFEPHLLGLDPHRLGHAMGRKHHNGAGRRFAQLINEYGAFLTQILDDITVMYDFMSHINRSEEHTSELQSLMRISYAVFCLKKKICTNNTKLS